MTAQTMEKIVKTLKVNPRDLFEFQDWNGGEEDSYIYVLNKVNLIRNNKKKMELLKKFLKFVL